MRKRAQIVGLSLGLLGAAAIMNRGYRQFLGIDADEIAFDAEIGWRQPLRPAPSEGAPGRRDAPMPGTSLLLLGDRVTRAPEIADAGKTFAGLLGAVGAGVDDFGTYQEVDYFRTYLAHAEPQRVGLIVNVIDLMPKRVAAAHAQEVLEGRFPFGFGAHQGLSAWLHARLASAHANADDAKEWTLRANRLLDWADPVDDEVMEDWGEAVSALRDAAHGRLFVVVIPPRAHIGGIMQGVGTPPVYEQVHALCRKLGIPSKDLLTEFLVPDYHSLYTQQFALSEAGHALAARTLKAFLAPRVAEREVDWRQEPL